MPVRLNLLAEAQAAAEERRRDPVKRAIMVAALLVSLMLGWNAWLQLGAMLTRRDITALERQMATHAKEHQQALDNQKKSADIQNKLISLRQLAVHRFLNGPMLDALQRTTVEDVQLVRLRTEQTYTMTEELKQRTNMSNGRVLPAEPAMATEKTVLTLDAIDSAPLPGDQVSQFKQTMANHPYFKNAMGKSNVVQLIKLEQPTVLADKSFVLFTLQCRYQDKTR